MKKKSLASIELAAIIKELQFLKRGKLSQIYHQDEEILLKLHAQKLGKQLLKIVPGKLLCLTKDKNPPLRPSGFCMQLRKYLDNASINDIFQKEAERIIVFELEKKEKYFLIVELFSKGNVILADSSYKIIGLLDRQIWKDRTVKAKELYVFPKPGVNWKVIEVEEFKKILLKSDRKNLATTLATEINLGGVYAEEICLKSKVEKNKEAKDLRDGEIDALYSELKEMLREIETPKGFLYEEQVTPFRLSEIEIKGTTSTYNEAINLLKPIEIKSPYESKIANLRRRIIEQEDAIIKLQEKIGTNAKKGELIYEKYSPLRKLLDAVKDMRKDKKWDEISVELKKEDKIKSVNLKDKKIVIDL